MTITATIGQITRAALFGRWEVSDEALHYVLAHTDVPAYNSLNNWRHPMTAIHWNGDLSNDPRSGFIVTTTGGLHVVQWDDGSTQTVPVFVVAGRGWRVG
jgi:hypothetical protein